MGLIHFDSIPLYIPQTMLIYRFCLRGESARTDRASSAESDTSRKSSPKRPNDRGNSCLASETSSYIGLSGN